MIDLPNARALAPLTNTQSHPDGTLSDAELDWLVRRARGGFGLVSTCAAHVSGEGKAWWGQLGIADDTHLPGLSRLATALRAAGARSVVQLFHGGLKAELAPERLGPMKATVDDLRRVVDDMVAAALRAKSAGFDGVEVHGANGYLFTQFLSPTDNRRVDKYGKHLVGRARLLRETVRAVKEAVGGDLFVGVRISPVDTLDRRGLLLDDGVQVARWLAEDGVDYVHLSLRDAAGPPPHEPGRGPVARAVRDALPPHVRVLAAGGIATRAHELRAREAGVDVVVVGRAAIRHADWARRVDDPTFSPAPPPWRPEELAAEGVSEAFLAYLRRFPNLIAG